MISDDKKFYYYNDDFTPNVVNYIEGENVFLAFYKLQNTNNDDSNSSKNLQNPEITHNYNRDNKTRPSENYSDQQPVRQIDLKREQFNQNLIKKIEDLRLKNLKLKNLVNDVLTFVFLHESKMLEICFKLLDSNPDCCYMVAFSNPSLFDRKFYEFLRNYFLSKPRNLLLTLVLTEKKLSVFKIKI